jgi:hypothetical protein
LLTTTATSLAAPVALTCATPCTVMRRSLYTIIGGHRPTGSLTTPPYPQRGQHLYEEKCHFTHRTRARLWRCSALASAFARRLCSPWPATAEPLSSPSKTGKRLANVASSSSTELELEPPVIDAGRASSPRCLLLLRGSSLTAAIRAPPASPPLQEEPLESEDRPCLHLCRR